jgi:hypothetical protein
MELKEAARIADSLGHRPGLGTTPRGLWFGGCTCGYQSVNKRTKKLAVESLIHHMLGVAKNADLNGRRVSDGMSVPGNNFGSAESTLSAAR